MVVHEHSVDSHASGPTSRGSPSARRLCLGQKPWRGATGFVATMPFNWRLRSHGRTRLDRTLSWPRSTVSYGRPRLVPDSKRGRTRWLGTEAAARIVRSLALAQ